MRKYYHLIINYNIVHSIIEIRFSEPQFSEILDLMNKLQTPFSYFTFIQTRFSEQTQFSEQKGSDNHVH